MAGNAQTFLKIGDYYSQFFAQSLKSQTGFEAKVTGLYQRVQGG
jgi:hypothetical protein